MWSSDESRLSLANAEADFGGVTMRALQSIEIDEEVKTEPMYGNGSVSIGAPDGQHSATVKFDTIPEEADLIKKNLGNGFARTLGTIGIYMQNSVSFENYTIELRRVKITKISAKLGKAGGSDPSLMTIEAMVMDPVNWNGVDAIDNLTGGAAVPVLGFGLSV